jgi:phage antirepressor YoqD-like protein
VSLSVQVQFAPADPRSILVQVEGQLTNRVGLHKVLAAALADQLQGHFRDKNRVPNRMNAPKTNFWNQIANATSVTEVSETGAVVSVAEDRFRIQLFGGEIRPKNKKALTIPLVKEARGLFARSYETKFNTRLFTIKGRRALFERTGRPTESLIYQTNVRVRQGKRALTIPLPARSGIRPVYALVPKVNIKADPTALPTREAIVTRLQEEANDFLSRETSKGGQA